MTGSQLADALGARGLGETDRPAIAAVFDRVLSVAHREAFWPYCSWTPGRLEVFGTHTDYAGGRSLVCAVPRGIALAARPRSDARVHVTDAASNESVEIAIGERTSFGGWRRYVAVTAARLAHNFPESVRGADIAFASTLPRASGMSSSSALVVAIAGAIVELSDLHQHEAWIANVRGALDVAGYYACIENGRSFGTLAGDAGVGTHGGSEDHAAILTGRPSTVSAFSFVPMTRLDDVAVPEEWRFVIAPSNVRAEKTGDAQASYNRLAEEVQALLAVWNARGQPAASLADAVRQAPDASDRLREMLRRLPAPRFQAESLGRRLEHFLREDALILPSIDAFRACDAAALGRLSAESQEIAESLLRNQVPETVGLARDARRLGAFAARSFGAGFGGSVWALVGAPDARRFAAAWHPDAFVMQPGPPHVAVA